jgi:hypothetical protein
MIHSTVVGNGDGPVMKGGRKLVERGRFLFNPGSVRGSGAKC